MTTQPGIQIPQRVQLILRAAGRVAFSIADLLIGCILFAILVILLLYATGTWMFGLFVHSIIIGLVSLGLILVMSMLTAQYVHIKSTKVTFGILTVAQLLILLPCSLLFYKDVYFFATFLGAPIAAQKPDAVNKLARILRASTPDGRMVLPLLTITSSLSKSESYPVISEFLNSYTSISPKCDPWRATLLVLSAINSPSNDSALLQLRKAVAVYDECGNDGWAAQEPLTEVLSTRQSQNLLPSFDKVACLLILGRRELAAGQPENAIRDLEKLVAHLKNQNQLLTLASAEESLAKAYKAAGDDKNYARLSQQLLQLQQLLEQQFPNRYNQSFRFVRDLVDGGLYEVAEPWCVKLLPDDDREASQLLLKIYKGEASLAKIERFYSILIARRVDLDWQEPVPIGHGETISMNQFRGLDVEITEPASAFSGQNTPQLFDYEFRGGQSPTEIIHLLLDKATFYAEHQRKDEAEACKLVAKNVRKQLLSNLSTISRDETTSAAERKSAEAYLNKLKLEFKQQLGTVDS